MVLNQIFERKSKMSSCIYLLNTPQARIHEPTLDSKSLLSWWLIKPPRKAHHLAAMDPLQQVNHLILLTEHMSEEVIK